jgi:hypothetical protein
MYMYNDTDVLSSQSTSGTTIGKGGLVWVKLAAL